MLVGPLEQVAAREVRVRLEVNVLQPKKVAELVPDGFRPHAEERQVHPLGSSDHDRLVVRVPVLAVPGHVAIIEDVQFYLARRADEMVRDRLGVPDAEQVKSAKLLE